MPDALDQLGAACDRARHDVRMAVQILGGAVDRKIEARLDGAKVDGTREGIVDDGYQAMGAREFHHRIEVGNLQQRIGHGLHIDGPRVGPQ